MHGYIQTCIFVVYKGATVAPYKNLTIKKMIDFATLVQNFLNELSHFTGRAPIFSIDYRRQELVIVDAPSGFVSQLLAGRFSTSLVMGKGLVVTQFKD